MRIILSILAYQNAELLALAWKYERGQKVLAAPS